MLQLQITNFLQPAGRTLMSGCWEEVGKLYTVLIYQCITGKYTTRKVRLKPIHSGYSVRKSTSKIFLDVS